MSRRKRFASTVYMCFIHTHLCSLAPELSLPHFKFLLFFLNHAPVLVLV